MRGRPVALAGVSTAVVRVCLAGRSGDDIRQRFKVITRVVNVEEAQFGRAATPLIRKYNGTPFLAKTTTSFYRGEGYFEVDIDVHRFSYLARVGLAGVAEQMKGLVLDYAFVIQGNLDEELPEQVLGSARLCKIDLAQSPAFPAKLLDSRDS